MIRNMRLEFPTSASPNKCDGRYGRNDNSANDDRCLRFRHGGLRGRFDDNAGELAVDETAKAGLFKGDERYVRTSDVSVSYLTVIVE